MSEEWPSEGFTATLRGRDRIVVLFYADWCPFSQKFLPEFEAVEPEANVPFARANMSHPLDARWDDFGVAVVPTVVYFEHGEELERIETARGAALSRDELENFLEVVDALNEEEKPRPKRRLAKRRS